MLTFRLDDIYTQFEIIVATKLRDCRSNGDKLS